MKVKVPKDFKAPDMTPYDGTSDPSHHLSNFRSRMYLTDASNAIRCKAFPTTLTKTAIEWFDSLPPRSITSFDDLAKKFLARFSTHKDKAKHAPRLLGIKQGDRESLRSYMERFNKACLDIQNLPTEAAIMGLINGLREAPFCHFISKKHPASLNEVQERAENTLIWKRTPDWEKPQRLDSPTHLGTRIKSPGRKKTNLLKNSENTTTTLVFRCLLWMFIRRYATLRRSYHLSRLNTREEEVGQKNSREEGSLGHPEKRHLKEVYHVGEGERSPDLPTITFTQEDATSIVPGHDDPVVITIILANANLHRTLVDQGSYADILFKSTFDKLFLQEKELRAYPNSLYGIGDTPIQPLGYIPLHTIFRKGTRSRTLSIDYIVVNVSSAYNALKGWTMLNQLAVVVSTLHLCIKFPTTEGIATIKGDQKLARHCYNESQNLKGDPRGKETNTIELGGIQAREELRPQSEGETEEVQIRDTQDKTTNMGGESKRRPKGANNKSPKG
ncbi:uncharacterized protein LOC130966442 [Arachis stenosperma]|uniref:uncharacterized protein LOC130966442 n=1 Tax=Arachis stenosperma TaxID=217475 RepID=UPI0025AC12A7|nr:uncharacterized protein LOC130966442 [Arachis stenosperma]